MSWAEAFDAAADVYNGVGIQTVSRKLQKLLKVVTVCVLVNAHFTRADNMVYV